MNLKAPLFKCNDIRKNEIEKDLLLRIRQAEQGKKLFKRLFDYNEINLDDAFLIILTDNEECINFGIEYLPDFIKVYCKRNVYILINNEKFNYSFSKVGGVVKNLKKEELEILSSYFEVFHKREFLDTRIIFLTEKEGYGSSVDFFLKKKEFSLEEYVAISLYQLSKLKGGN